MGKSGVSEVDAYASRCSSLRIRIGGWIVHGSQNPPRKFILVSL